jgi:inorganic pyrophosphatase
LATARILSTSEGFVGKKDKHASRKNTITAVIETPCGSRNKYAWDEQRKAFRLKKVLPSGMVFPYNFGFVPDTRADDGDPLDVLVLMDAPAFPGCILECVLLGAIEAEQSNGNGKKERNDRLVAADVNDSSFSDINGIEQLPAALINEIEAFFVNYNRVEGKKFRILRLCNAKHATKLIKKACKK